MPRHPSPEREAEFQRLGALIDAIISAMPSSRPPGMEAFSVAAEARRIREVAGFSPALEGLRQALNDTLEMAGEATDAQVAAINQKLAGLGEPHLSVLLAHRERRVRRILKTRRLADETEYYLLKEYVENLASGLARSDRELAERLLSEYELGRRR